MVEEINKLAPEIALAAALHWGRPAERPQRWQVHRILGRLRPAARVFLGKFAVNASPASPRYLPRSEPDKGGASLISALVFDPNQSRGGPCGHVVVHGLSGTGFCAAFVSD